MRFEEKIKQLVQEIERLDRNAPGQRLPQNVFYLKEDALVCMEREHGESRYPYDADGLVVWARSTGYIEACESTFHIFKPIPFSEDPSVNFFAGTANDRGGYDPVSVFGVTRQLQEEEKVARYVVYEPCCAYYITVTKALILAVRLHVDLEKHIHFSYGAINRTDRQLSIYLASVLEAILRFRDDEGFWDRMTKFGKREGDSYLLRSQEDCLVMNRSMMGGTVTQAYHTVGKSGVLGSGRMMANAPAWERGAFSREQTGANTAELPVAADLFRLELAAGGAVRLAYELSYYHSVAEAEQHMGERVCIEQIDSRLAERDRAKRAGLDGMKIHFADWQGKADAQLLNHFLRSVQNQVTLCAMGKNYAGSFIGIRDVMQQLESSLIWQPGQSREKLLRVFRFILEDGRPPRQFSVPASEDLLPEMDLRKFIDQGNWIISTMYTYLAYTEDYSILQERCGYYIPDEANTRIVARSKVVDTVLEHMLKIMDFLIRCLDTEQQTNCLRALYGDWNDSMDGPGRTDDCGKEFGSGVSVMASLHLYQNCREMREILSHTGLYGERIGEYDAVSRKLEEGLFAHAIDVSAAGERRIVHGWGDKLSYKLGSFHDPDGAPRISSTSHSFWVLSGMIRRDLSLKEAVVLAFRGLQSRYGLKTFDRPFPETMVREAGRICSITPGTYENAAAYVHAAMFASMALFEIGESAWAWQEIEKSIVITHDNCSMTPFVMPNSYCENPKYGMDGESMGDWYTGSGTVLIKQIVKDGFGVAPDLDGLWLQTAKTLPCTKAELEIVVKGHPIILAYRNEKSGVRSFLVDGQRKEGVYDELLGTARLRIPSEELHDHMEIQVID